MLDANWPDSWRGAFRIELRAEAIGLAWRGWPVLPGVNPAPLTDGDDLTWRRPVPASDNWREQIGTHAHEVATWFSDRTHSLLVATGTVLDAIEVDDELGKRACRLPARPRPPGADHRAAERPLALPHHRRRPDPGRARLPRRGPVARQGQLDPAAPVAVPARCCALARQARGLRLAPAGRRRGARRARPRPGRRRRRAAGPDDRGLSQPEPPPTAGPSPAEAEQDTTPWTTSGRSRHRVDATPRARCPGLPPHPPCPAVRCRSRTSATERRTGNPSGTRRR